jgi:uncharacterized protein (TIGR01777 family)
MRSLKIVLPGGSGHLGRLLTRTWIEAGHQVVVLSRRPPARPLEAASFVEWNGRTPGPWMRALDGADVLVNLAGRSVDCRYDKNNLRAMLDSRVESTRVLGQACAEARVPPRVWLQSSTATLYAHRHDAANDEASGRIGGGEPDAPPNWRGSNDIALAWEAELAAAPTPGTRKVALRTAMVMSGEPASVFDVLVRLARMGLGGTLADGDQYVSWIHARDSVCAVDWLIEREDFSGPVNVCAPGPLPQREFARVLRRAAGVRVGLPATRWMLELGAFLLRTDTELLLKSRRVVPGRMLAAGFRFDFPEWSAAARELVERRRSRHRMPVEVGSSP